MSYSSSLVEVVGPIRRCLLLVGINSSFDIKFDAGSELSVLSSSIWDEFNN
jgi:hypothetical protein